MNFIIRLLISAAVAFGLTKVLSGTHIDDFQTALIFALILAFLNTFIRPILKVIGFPLTLLTLGLFALVINTLMVMLAAHFLPENMHFDGFLSAFIFSILFSLITSLLDGIFTSKND